MEVIARDLTGGVVQKVAGGRRPAIKTIENALRNINNFRKLLKGGTYRYARIALESTYFWTALALIIFFGLIYWKGRSAIKQSLDTRINRIRLELEEAESLKEEALATLQDYQRKQRNAIEQADQIIAAAQAQAEHLKQEAQTKLEEILKRREAF